MLQPTTRGWPRYVDLLWGVLIYYVYYKEYGGGGGGGYNSSLRSKMASS